MKATWNGAVIAESDDIVTVEGNAYFPRNALHSEYFAESNHHTTCPWKGVASYLDVVVKGQTNENAAWTYLDPKPEAVNIKGRVAFWRGVQVSS